MSSHSKALEKAKKHSHKKGKDGKCEVCNELMETGGKLDEKGNKANLDYKFNKDEGAKNNDSEEV